MTEQARTEAIMTFITRLGPLLDKRLPTLSKGHREVAATAATDTFETLLSSGLVVWVEEHEQAIRDLEAHRTLWRNAEGEGQELEAEIDRLRSDLAEAMGMLSWAMRFVSLKDVPDDEWGAEQERRHMVSALLANHASQPSGEET